jgi:hypothetical protein
MWKKTAEKDSKNGTPLKTTPTAIECFAAFQQNTHPTNNAWYLFHHRILSY